MSGELVVSSSDRGVLVTIASMSPVLGLLVSMPCTSPESSESVLTLRDFASELSSDTLVQRDVSVSDGIDAPAYGDFSVSVISLSMSSDSLVSLGKTLGDSRGVLPSVLSVPFDFWAWTSCWQRK